MTVEGGSGCLKELSIPAALLEERLKQSVPLQRPKTHTHTHSGLLCVVLPTDGGDPLCPT